MLIDFVSFEFYFDSIVSFLLFVVTLEALLSALEKHCGRQE